MVQWVVMPASKVDNLASISGSHMMDGRKEQIYTDWPLTSTCVLWSGQHNK